MSNWFADHARKVHILYVSPDWVKRRGQRFDARRLADSLAEARVETVQFYCKDHHGVCYYPCSEGLAYPFDAVGPLVDACHEAGVRFMAYFSVGFDNYALGIHRDWIYTKPDGDSWSMGPFDFACLNSPYADFALRQWEELVSRYPVDGAWLDMIPLTWHEYEKPVYGGWHGEMVFPCHCLHCQRRFLAERGRDLPRPASGAEQLEVFRFGVEAAERYLRDSDAIMRRYRPEAVVTYNNAGVTQDPLFMSDLVTIEAHSPAYQNQSWAARSARSRGKPFEVLNPGAVRGWNGFDQKPLALAQLETAIPAAHGGTATIGVAARPDGSLEPGALQSLGTAFSRLEKLEPHLMHTKPVSEVGLLLLVDPLNSPREGVPHLVEAHGFHQVLLEDHVQYQIITSTEQLGRFAAVIVPNLTALSDSDAGALEQYVAGGGRLLVTGEAGSLDEVGRRREAPALAELAGLSSLQWTPWRYAFVRPKSSALFVGIPDIPIRIAGPIALIGGAKAEVMARVELPEAPATINTTLLWHEPVGDEDRSYPYALLNHHGDGVCVYAASALTSSIARFGGLANGWVKELTRRLVETVLPAAERMLVTDAPPGCEVVLNRQPGRLIVSLVNAYAGAPDYSAAASGGVRLGPIAIALRSLAGGRWRVALQPEDSELPVQVSGEEIRFTVPSFEVYCVVTVDLAKTD